MAVREVITLVRRSIPLSQSIGSSPHVVLANKMTLIAAVKFETATYYVEPFHMNVAMRIYESIN
jgi:hypothetical protein